MNAAKKTANRKYLDILDAATDLFLEQGYQDTSITKLLNRFGGSRETIYRHFKSKEELFSAVLEHQIKDYLEFMESLDIKSDDLRQGLLEWSASLVNVVTSERYIKLRRLVYSEVGNWPELGQLYYDHTFMKGTTAITGFLEKQQQQHRLKPVDSRTMTLYLVGMMLYQLMHRRLLNLQPAPSRKEITALTEAVIDDFITAFGTNQ